MKQNEQISGRQLWTAISLMLLADTFHTVPRAVAIRTSSAAPWAILVTAAAAFLLVWPVAAALARRPGQDLMEFSLAAGGRPLSIAVSLLVTGYAITINAMTLREVSEMAITALYPHTPQTFLISTLLLAAAIGAALSPAGLIWLGSVWTWPVVASIAIILAGNIGWARFSRILPMTGTGVLPVLSHVPALTSYFGQLFYFTIFCKYLADPGQLPRGVLKTTGLVAVTWALVMGEFLMVFPLSGALAAPFPTFELSQLILGGRYMERMDVLWMLFWTIGAAARIATGIAASALALKGAFRFPSHRIAVLPLASAILSASLFPSNQEGAVAADMGLRQFNYLITLVLPLLVVLLAAVRRRKAGA